MLVGNGPLKPKSELLAKKIGIVNKVLFLGDRTDIPQILKSSNIIVLSSKYEGLSLSSIEGMISGKPFVASKVEGLREMVQNFGVLFEVGNEVDLAEKLKKLLNDEQFYNLTVKNCLNKAEDFNIKKMTMQYIELYINSF